MREKKRKTYIMEFLKLQTESPYHEKYIMETINKIKPQRCSLVVKKSIMFIDTV